MSTDHASKLLVQLSDIAWRVVAIAVAISIVVSVWVGLGVVLLPMLLALFLASVLEPVYSALRRRRWRPALASSVCIALPIIGFIVLALVALSALVGPWNSISAQLTTGLDVLQNDLENLVDHDLTGVGTAIRAGLGGAVHFLLHGAFALIAIAVSVFSTAALALLVLFFFLKDGETLWTWTTSFAGGRRDDADRIGRVMWAKMRDFIRGTSLVALADSTGIALGAAVLGVPSVTAIWLLTFVMAFIPYFGAFFAGAVAVLLAVADGGLRTGVLMALVVLAVQQIESNLLQPVLVGRAVKLHPLAVSLGVIVGGSIAGVLGMFFAIPVIAAAVAGWREYKLIVEPVAIEPAVDSG
jgi:predicted PurR-regulated permease PerM